MASRVVSLALGIATLVALAMVLVALPFLPASAWEQFVPVATVVGAVCVVGSAALAAWVAQRLTRPLGELVRVVEREEPGQDTLRELADQSPEELSLLLYALHRAQRNLRQTLAELEADRAQVAAILEHMADGVLVVDSNDLVVTANPAARRLLRVAATVVNGRFPEVVRDPDIVQVARSVGPSGAVTQVVELNAAHGVPARWVQVVATRLPNTHGHTLILLQDVSDLRRAEVARRDFVANLSHELRTPLSAIRALAETLDDGALEDPAAGRGFIQRMLAEIEGLTHMASELLELARVESGQTVLELAPCAVDDLLDEAIERLGGYAERRGLEVWRTPRVRETLSGSADYLPRHPAAAGAELWVQADRFRMGQVLANLLANAVKFTPSGGWIELGAVPSGDSVELWVRDSGIGIRPENLDRVFERFYKTDPSRTGSGTGLGLAICKHLVRAHGGTIWAESPGDGQGATFRVRLPRVPAPTEHSPSGPEPGGHGPTHHAINGTSPAFAAG